ncbi:MAG: DUF2807 domain-containing protein [Spirochaetales bacterium]|nr:DUF2807 domain-containing protein [Spirochaetales bacterium]
MKTSNKILFITGLAIVVILLTSVIGSRIFLNKFADLHKNGNTNYSNIENKYKDIIDFTSLDIEGEWNVSINYGKTYNISITGRTGIEDPYNIEKKGSALFLTENTLADINRKLTINITMPEIKKLYSKGGLKLDLTGFSEPELILNFTGGTWVSGNNCQFENLLLTSAGAINLEFEDIKTVNVDAQLSGAGNLIFNMDGGILSGIAAGAMNIEYYGNADQTIVAAGLASISHRD